ncbi:MAG: FHA domain-containing protein [Actinomycetia bacterium]|nr:FHA domain-containing protein [Actinomycetes bacterium]
MGVVAFTAVKVGFLAVLWLFVALVGRTIRTDLFAPATGVLAPNGAGRADREAQPNPKRRGRGGQGARLVVVAGAGVGDGVPLNGEIVVGRGSDCTLDIDDDYASSHHARLYHDEQSWIIADLGSTNGTYINGVRIVRATRVGEGDIIRIGRTQLQMEG